MERDQASKFVHDLLRLMVSRNGSDLFLTADFPPAIKVDGKITKVSPQPLPGQHTMALARSVMNDKQAAEFERTKECNFAISPTGIGRFRCNAFVQQGNIGLIRAVEKCHLSAGQVSFYTAVPVVANVTRNIRPFRDAGIEEQRSADVATVRTGARTTLKLIESARVIRAVGIEPVIADNTKPDRIVHVREPDLAADRKGAE